MIPSRLLAFSHLRRPSPQLLPASRLKHFKEVLHRIQTTLRVLKPLSMLMKSPPSDLLLGLRFALYSYCESFGKGSLLLGYSHQHLHFANTGFSLIIDPLRQKDGLQNARTVSNTSRRSEPSANTLLSQTIFFLAHGNMSLRRRAADQANPSRGQFLRGRPIMPARTCGIGIPRHHYDIRLHATQH